ncbi:DUF4097 family beta strand repeat-containing protein [Kitasatospora sp. GAS204B]|uniref:DUF4097 family beta strand repeat-containing protein n=1 Tax=unclassified Kitasatospora TaxID=2633591 RepID=UPI0024772352|nr:DUF4097 family beta strand repeat-containing protein [Kitasatospora sp. GAS204B]MDH6118672.1 hypothetical protein [Kitasatospora sp. GAS204B]
MAWLSGAARPGRERRIWRSIGTLSGVLVVLVGAGQTWSGLVRQSAVRPASYPSGVTALELDVQNASVSVTATDKDHVTVQQVEHWTVSRPVVTRTVVDNTLRISARCPQVLGISEPSCSVGLDIGAPLATAVTLTSSSGDTRIRGLAGDLSLRSYSGSIQLDDVSGRIAARLTSGSISGTNISSAEVQAAVTSGSVDLGFAAPPRSTALNCSSGSLTVRLPPGSTYRLNVAGPSDVNPALNDPTSPNSIVATCGSGHTGLGYTSG